MITKGKDGGVTQQQIADHLGISRQLVTHALNGTNGSRISEETRAEIIRVARELNYKPRNLTTHNIGYLLPNEGIYLEAEHTLAMTIERAARAAGFRLLVVGIQGPEDLASLSEVLNAKTVDGIIYPRWYGDEYRQFFPSEVPWIAVTAEDGVPQDVDLVSTNTRSTSRMMAEYLIEKGHRRIAFTCSAADVKQHRDLQLGIEDAYQSNGLSLDDLWQVRGPVKDIVHEIKGVIEAPVAPTAWIASTPKYATTVLFSLYSSGKRVPEDVSLMCFMDSPHFDSLPSPVTATTAVGSHIADFAVTRLVERIRGSKMQSAHHLLPSEIVERSSVSKCLQ